MNDDFEIEKLGNWEIAEFCRCMIPGQILTPEIQFPYFPIPRPTGVSRAGKIPKSQNTAPFDTNQLLVDLRDLLEKIR